MSEADKPIQPVLCSRCFRNQGLRLDAERIGLTQAGRCPHCQSDDGAKLDKDRVETLAFRFFVRGTYRRSTYGGAPVVQFNEHHYQKSEIDLPDSLRDDVALIEEAARVGFFYYGPRFWMLGEVEPLKSLQDARQRPEVIKRILDVYPKPKLETGEVFYRLRKEPKNPGGPERIRQPAGFLSGKVSLRLARTANSVRVAGLGGLHS